jgi:hypothetical protein
MPSGGSLVTPIARFVWDAQGLVLDATSPGVTVEEVRERTGFPVRHADHGPTTIPPGDAAERAAYVDHVLPALRSSGYDRHLV